MKRSGLTTDGCATFYNKDKFELENIIEIDLN
jgi:hypothetical protein